MHFSVRGFGCALFYFMEESIIMKFKKMTAAALAAALAATNVAIAANAAEQQSDNTIVQNGVKYVINTLDDGTKEVLVSPENNDITEAVILPEVNGVKVTFIGYASDMMGVGGFSECTKLTKITIPSGINFIPPSFGLGMLTGVTDIYYGGTQEEWEDEMQKLADSQGGTPFENCKNLTMHYSSNNDPAPSEPNTSEPAPDPTESTVTPGGTDPAAKPGGSDKPANQDIIEVTLKNVDSENGIEGEALDKLLFGDSGLTWEQVEKIEFSSDDLFSVQFSTDNGGWRKLGEEVAARADDENIWNTEWTLNTSEMAKDKKFAKVIAKDGIIDVTAKVYIKSNAEKPSGDSSGADQQPTGITLAIAPVVLAASAAIVVFKKKK